MLSNDCMNEILILLTDQKVDFFLLRRSHCHTKMCRNEYLILAVEKLNTLWIHNFHMFEIKSQLRTIQMTRK